MTRGPYRSRTGRGRRAPGKPSVVRAENLAAYRGLRHLTQAELAGVMTELGHDMIRSTVSAIESLGRSVTVDELFGLAVSLGATVGQLLDPTGPDHSRTLGLDLGLRAPDGASRPVGPWTGHLLAASRVLVRLPPDEGDEIEIHPAGGVPPPAQRELDDLERLRT